LPAIPSRTALLYVTISASGGGTVVWPSGSGFFATFTGTMFTIGTSYAVAYTVNGVTAPATVVTAAAPSNPSDAGAEIDVTTPFSNLSLAPGNIVGIVVAR
jgi:hypothetical protein